MQKTRGSLRVLQGIQAVDLNTWINNPNVNITWSKLATPLEHRSGFLGKCKWRISFKTVLPPGYMEYVRVFELYIGLPKWLAILHGTKKYGFVQTAYFPRRAPWQSTFPVPGPKVTP